MAGMSEDHQHLRYWQACLLGVVHSGLHISLLRFKWSIVVVVFDPSTMTRDKRCKIGIQNM